MMRKRIVLTVIAITLLVCVLGVLCACESYKAKALDKVGQHHVFHSVMHFFGMTSPIYNPELDIFE